MTNVEEILAANAAFAAAFDAGGRPIKPARRLVVVTCMDSRIDAFGALGLKLGDAHVIRNAGGIVSDDVLRSLVISHHLLGTQEAVVIGHTDCGMVTFTNDELRARLGPAAADVDFLPFSSMAARVRESVAAIAATPLLPDSYAATGFVYDVTSGRLEAV